MLGEYSEHHHRKWNHRGIDTITIDLIPNDEDEWIVRRERFGAMLKYDYREDA